MGSCTTLASCARLCALGLLGLQLPGAAATRSAALCRLPLAAPRPQPPAPSPARTPQCCCQRDTSQTSLHSGQAGPHLKTGRAHDSQLQRCPVCMEQCMLGNTITHCRRWTSCRRGTSGGFLSWGKRGTGGAIQNSCARTLTGFLPAAGCGGGRIGGPGRRRAGRSARWTPGWRPARRWWSLPARPAPSAAASASSLSAARAAGTACWQCRCTRI